MATPAQPWPRKANRIRKASVVAAMEILQEIAPLKKRKDIPLDVMQALLVIAYNSHFIVEQLTSVPSDGESGGLK